MIEFTVGTKDGPGGQLFKRPRGKYYTDDEREFIRLAVIGGMWDLMRDLVNITPVATGLFASGWRFELDGKNLGSRPPEKSKHGRGSAGNRKATKGTTGYNALRSKYKLGDNLAIEAPPLKYSVGKPWIQHGRYSVDRATSFAFNGAFEQVVNSFSLAFEEIRESV